MKIISWNVNGIRAIQGKGFAETLAQLDADCILLQETKAQSDQIEKALEGINGYHIYSNCAERKGYSGVTILSRHEPLLVIRDIGIAEHDREGRVIVAEFEGFYLLNVYVPNSGEALARLDYRQIWDGEFLAYLQELQSKKPVIACGDFNVAHQEIDIARPKANYNKSSGYTQVEIDGFSRMIKAGWVDTFRHFHPDTVAYSWWSYRANARVKNIGWRIDYVLTSQTLIDKVRQAFILPDILGSDHCPVGIEIAL
ncbi:MAG: exodeoxyribonuclease III [Methylicorpusculum sp.]|uniref:exodeoxyribonuclease III n=1 Tax=Methylicorpusculum sp. TaxID=2713644 RepID=UPI0027209108|nr:exodeoxyribonuclease III [Methylicorpusculum sp.]MDO8846547.1 exodeoxyribonuclease III [Methylicorpusculum sp.]MDO8938125.1 exodeoxyribonuclease III [Methylicorpusculum sp.]MDO9240120.1 exodeoxyribonuclease III [Methylicorpusculum sp.]MDP2202462.1 exodeoxyribonuclease III [Methylicorpusculum sp.]